MKTVICLLSALVISNFASAELVAKKVHKGLAPATAVTGAAQTVPGTCVEGKHKVYDYCGDSHCISNNAAQAACNPPSNGSMPMCSGSHPSCKAVPENGACANDHHGEYTHCKTVKCVPNGARLPHCTTVPANGCRNDCTNL